MAYVCFERMPCLDFSRWYTKCLLVLGQLSTKRINVFGNKKSAVITTATRYSDIYACTLINSVVSHWVSHCARLVNNVNRFSWTTVHCQTLDAGWQAPATSVQYKRSECRMFYGIYLCFKRNFGSLFMHKLNYVTTRLLFVAVALYLQSIAICIIFSLQNSFYSPLEILFILLVYYTYLFMSEQCEDNFS